MSTIAPTVYWEERAQKFAADGDGLRAVCSYGMPWFYNGTIHLTQWLALRRWLRIPAGSRALDVGCGIGRWSRLLAHRGAVVTGVDLSPTMISEAQKRARDESVDCLFLTGDLASLDLGQVHDFIVGVTVLQHIMDEQRFEEAIRRLADHLDQDGRLVLLEAAPSRQTSRCDTAIFRARTATDYHAAFDRAGLRCITETGVDPAPFKTLYLPFHRRLPKWLGNLILFFITAASLPIDLIFGRVLKTRSWHKVFVLEKRR